jgi:hypothetical protein
LEAEREREAQEAKGGRHKKGRERARRRAS